MKKIEEKYLNFDGVSSEVPNDMPWGQTNWSNLTGTDWQEEGYSGTGWQDANLNASGDAAIRLLPPDINRRKNANLNATGDGGWKPAPPFFNTPPTQDRRSAKGETGFYHTSPDASYSNFLPSSNQQPSITLEHHHQLSPNMVLEDNDNSTMPDSDIWSNHPGFIGGTWWKDFWFPKKAEAERAAKARESIDSKYPISGSCDVLTATAESINADLAHHAKATKRGPKRIAKRNIPILNNKLKTVVTNRDIQCESEAQDQLQDDKLDMFIQSQMQQPEQKQGVSATNVILGLVIIGGLVWGISRLAKPQAPVVVAAPVK
jgi:hypothetical protein